MVEGRLPLLPDLGCATEGADLHPNKQAAAIYATATSQPCLETLSCRTASPQLSVGTDHISAIPVRNLLLTLCKHFYANPLSIDREGWECTPKVQEEAESTGLV